MRCAFLTLDGLTALADCPDVDDDPEARRIMRPMWKHPGDSNFGEYRVYERTATLFNGFPLFAEIADVHT